VLIRAAAPAPACPRRRPPVGAATLAALAATAVLFGACSPAAPGTPGPTASPTFSPIPPGDASGIPTLPPSSAAFL
jgi:hypothetical protein